MSDQQSQPTLNRHQRRRIAKIGAERAEAEDARPEWVRVSDPGSVQQESVHVCVQNICVKG